MSTDLITIGINFTMIGIKNKLQFLKEAHISYTLLNHWRNNTLWATKRKSKTSKDVAMDYFDNVYSPLFGKRWPSIRLALLSPNKYCAVINNFGDIEENCTQLQDLGSVNIREVFEIQKEVLLKNKLSSKRQKELNHIYDLDKKLQQIVSQKREEDIKNIYPSDGENLNTRAFSSATSETEKGSLEMQDLIKQAKLPLEKSILEASIDTDRQIDPSEGFSSSRLNDFVPVTKLKGKEGFVSEAEHFSFFNDPIDFPVVVEPEETLNFPPHLQVFIFHQGVLTDFPPGKSGSTGVTGYYLMDGASILPVLALDIKPGDTVLDMCSAPGGKSLVCLQTFYPELLVCNDTSLSRLNRLQNIMQQYIPDWEKKVTISHNDGAILSETETFSKILVDVPCTTDRHSATEDDNNIFKSSRNKERILLPQEQVGLLFNALKKLKRGGSVVYSTCSLNPAQNDGVIQMALRKVWEETSIKVVVKDLNEALEPARSLFRFAEPHCLRYGSLVVPFLPANFGPMYFCKLQRID